MQTTPQGTQQLATVDAIFAAIRSLVDERFRNHQQTKSPLDDDDLIEQVAAFARRFGAIDQSTALTALIRFARERELRDVANQIAILAYERFGQPLHILDEQSGEVST
jgi:hypothetical protein